VLQLGEMPDPQPAAGKVRIRIAASGITQATIKETQKRV
jgi:NADPH:quinone reductase-like Zn-dependent oxidoreductase